MPFALSIILLLSACGGADTDRADSPGMPFPAAAVQIPVLEPGAPTTDTVAVPYTEDAWSLYAGRRLYAWLNCVGCHANGGGGIGPALADAQWIYGSEPVNIFATIWQGRSGGMPAFGGVISQAEAWNLVAYVRSIGRLTREEDWAPLGTHMRGPLVADDPHTGSPTPAARRPQIVP